MAKKYHQDNIGEGNTAAITMVHEGCTKLDSVDIELNQLCCTHVDTSNCNFMFHCWQFAACRIFELIQHMSKDNRDPEEAVSLESMLESMNNQRGSCFRVMYSLYWKDYANTYVQKLSWMGPIIKRTLKYKQNTRPFQHSIDNLWKYKSKEIIKEALACNHPLGIATIRRGRLNTRALTISNYAPLNFYGALVPSIFIKHTSWCYASLSPKHRFHLLRYYTT